MNAYVPRKLCLELVQIFSGMLGSVVYDRSHSYFLVYASDKTEKATLLKTQLDRQRRVRQTH